MSSYWDLVTLASEEMCLQNKDRRFTQADYDVMCNVVETEMLGSGKPLFPCSNSRVSSSIF